MAPTSAEGQCFLWIHAEAVSGESKHRPDSLKPVLTKALHIVQKKRIFNNMHYAQYIHLMKGQAYS
jgi:hypothetical protein